MIIYLGKGEHFFFACFDELGADLAQWAADGKVTDFCSEIETLKPVYQKSDNIKITVKPMYCDMENADELSESDDALFGEYCVPATNAGNVERPKIVVNSAYVNFNVTNEMLIEDIEFEGNDNFAFYKEEPNKGKPVMEFPTRFCQ